MGWGAQRRANAALSWLGVFLIFSGAALAEAVTLTFQYRGGGARTETVNAWIAEFERTYPQIKIRHLNAVEGWEDRSLVAWAGGTGPDVTELWGDFAQAAARAGALLDLRPHVRRDFSSADVADFWPAAWDASFLKFGPNAGMQLRIPRYMITTVFYYNADMFARAGLANPNDLERRGEWTWDALRQAARKLTISTGNQVTQHGFMTNTGAYRRLVTWARAAGGDFFDPADPTNFVGDEPAAAAALTLLQDMIWNDGAATARWDRARFSKGTVAMLEEGNHAVLAVFDREIKESFNWDIAPAVVGPNGRQSYTGDDGFAIWRQTKHPEEAWTFVKFLTSTRGQEIAARFEGLAPVRRSAMPAYLTLSDRLHLDVLVPNMSDAGAPISSFLVGDVSAVGSALTNMLTVSLVNNQKPYPAAAREAAAVVESLLKGASATSKR